MNIIESIQTAVRTERTITFLYNGEQRTVNAEDLKLPEGKSGYVTGHDLDRDAVRRFTLSKISEITVL